MEGKESQKDILRLRQLEQVKHENNSTSTPSSEQTLEKTLFTNEPVVDRLNTDFNGFMPGLVVQSENN